MVNEIYIIDNATDLVVRIANLFNDNQDYIFKHIVTSDLEVALRNIPSLIIINEDNIDMNILSMGMSGDYEQAILNGSNLVRIGSSIFGPRMY